MTSRKYFRVDFTKGIWNGDADDEDFDPDLQPPSASLQVAVTLHNHKAYIGDECSEFSEFEELVATLKEELEITLGIARKQFAEEAHRRDIEETKAKDRNPDA